MATCPLETGALTCLRPTHVYTNKFTDFAEGEDRVPHVVLYFVKEMWVPSAAERDGRGMSGFGLKNGSWSELRVGEVSLGGWGTF